VYFARLVHEAGEPEFKYVANMHGDEVLGRELLLQLVTFLCDNYGKSDLVTSLVDTTRIHVIPCLNPDGYSRQRRPNANNVDLNRNFPSLLSPAASARIQPETAALIDWSRLYPFVLSANLHSGSQVVNYPYDFNAAQAQVDSPTPDDSTFRMLSLAYSRANLPMLRGQAPCVQHTRFKEGIVNGAVWYVADRTMQDWNYEFTNDFEVTVELSCEKLVRQADLRRYWDENKFALLSYVGQVHKGVRGLVKASGSGAPVSGATIQVEGIAKNVTSFVDGDYWRLLSPGKYVVSASHPDFVGQSRQIEVKDGAATVADFTLERRGKTLASIICQLDP
jgi:carboxypeptidase D